MTLILHAHPLSSYCWKALIALYENGAPFRLNQIDFGDEASAAAFVALWPLAKMPALEDDGRVIVESSSIVEYLDLKHPGPARLVPPDPEAALEVRTLDRIFDNYVMTPMQAIVFDRIRPDGTRDPFSVAQARALLAKSYAWLEGKLADRDWAAGDDFSLADCAAMPSLHYANRVQPFGADFPNLAAYLARVEVRPSAARVLAEAAPFAHFFPQDPDAAAA
jgi:glutathione S-transferase